MFNLPVTPLLWSERNHCTPPATGINKVFKVLFLLSYRANAHRIRKVTNGVFDQANLKFLLGLFLIERGHRVQYFFKGFVWQPLTAGDFKVFHRLFERMDALLVARPFTAEQEGT